MTNPSQADERSSFGVDPTTTECRGPHNEQQVERQDSPDLPSGNRRLSVVIPAFNEERTIAGTLEGARRGRAFEVIVVDGGSTDRTSQIAREGAT